MEIQRKSDRGTKAEGRRESQRDSAHCDARRPGPVGRLGTMSSFLCEQKDESGDSSIAGGSQKACPWVARHP